MLLFTSNISPLANYKGCRRQTTWIWSYAHHAVKNKPSTIIHQMFAICSICTVLYVCCCHDWRFEGETVTAMCMAMIC